MGKETQAEETKEVINEAVKEVTGKSVDDLKAEIEANELEIDKAFAAEYETLCAKFKRRAVPNPQLKIQRLK